MRKTRQEQFNQSGFRKEKSEHGGSLKNPQKRKRPLGLRGSTHLVLRSTKATKKWSFKKYEREIDKILDRFARKYHIHISKRANVGNHLHLQLNVSSRKSYRAFIRAVTSAIRTLVTGFSRWNKAPIGFLFWDQRPFSRIVSSWREFLNLSQYVEINRWEGLGVSRERAKNFVTLKKWAPEDCS